MPKNTSPVNSELVLSVMVQLAAADREEGSPRLLNALSSFSFNRRSLASVESMVDDYRVAADLLIKGASK